MLAADFEVRVGAEVPRAEVAAAARGAAVLVPTFVDRVDAGLLDALPTVRLVASYGVGTDHLDLEACRARGVTVTNTPDVLTDTTADHAFALLLAVARRVAEGDRLVRRGGWTAVDPGWFLGTDVRGKRLGLIGLGRIGRAMARRAGAFGLEVVYADERPQRPAGPMDGAERVTLDALLETSDFVSLHVPLTPETAGLLSRERLARMKPGAILVNTARGAVVDEDALAEALAAGRLGGAGLDVFRAEPGVPASLRALENVVLTPHVGSGTRETRAAMARLVLDELQRFARGAPPRHRVV
ncbi:MAG: D-glycerate dehydrogenase [Anaeromyxobacteraceae bacterium]